MNSIWNKNYKLFKERFPKLAEILPPPPKEPEKLLEAIWTLSPAKSGDLTATELGLRLHSAYNPKREATGALTAAGLENKSTAVFYGFGLGYHVLECARLFPQKKLVLIEPDICHFYAALCLLDWEEVFKIEKLVLALGCPENQILGLIEDSSKIGGIGDDCSGGIDNTVFFDIAAFTAHASAYFDNIRTIIKRNKQKNDINAATLKKFGKLWCRNSLENIIHVADCPGVQPLQASLKDTPFIICGAGPSLESILPHLKELSKHAILVCVETALHALQGVNLQPDFILLTDPQFWAYRHIAGLSATESILITEVSAYPSVFRFPCKRVMLCKSQFPIGSWFEEKLSLDLADLGSGGSVASCAWNFARLCGASEIYTIGLDFAFPAGQTHIRGSSAEQSQHTVSNRLNGVEKFTSASLHNANVQYGKDYTGKPVLTDSRMKMFAWWFESRLAACPENKTYTLCPQGLNVPGISPADISQLLSKPEIEGIKKSIVARAANAKPCLPYSKQAQLEKLINEFPTADFLERYGFLKDYL